MSRVCCGMMLRDPHPDDTTIGSRVSKNPQLTPQLALALASRRHSAGLCAVCMHGPGTERASRDPGQNGARVHGTLPLCLTEP